MVCHHHRRNSALSFRIIIFGSTSVSQPPHRLSTNGAGRPGGTDQSDGAEAPPLSSDESVSPESLVSAPVLGPVLAAPARLT